MLGVVHLVWGPLGPAPLRAFLESYRRYRPGTDHELVLIFNGVVDRTPFARELAGIEHRLIELDKPVLDLPAYRRAAQQLDHECLVLLNSYSRVLADDWLAKVAGALAAGGIGLVGASGSWASLHSYALFRLGLPSAYAQWFGDRAAAAHEFEALRLERSPVARAGLPRAVRGASAVRDMLQGFERFPAPHVRTNAIALKRELFIELTNVRVRRKVHGHRLESGRDGLTRRIEGLGLRPVVVDRAGAPYEPDAWPRSETFWQGAQRGLLVADNQTDTYEHGDLARRTLLSRYAWGERAAPLAAGGQGGPRPRSTYTPTRQESTGGRALGDH